MAGPHCERIDGMASQIYPPPANQHRILRQSREYICSSFAQCFCFPIFWFGWVVNIPFIPLIWTDNGGRSMAGLTVSALWLVSSKFYVYVRLRVFNKYFLFDRHFQSR